MDPKSTPLFQFLMSKNKGIINEYRKVFNCDVKSTLNKEDMAAGVARYLYTEPEYWMRMLPMWELHLIEELIKHKPEFKYNAGFIPVPSLLESFRLISAEYNEKEETLYTVSEEMHKAFNAGIRNAEAFFLCKDFNDFEIYYYGLLNLYGVVDAHTLFKQLASIGEEINEEEGRLNAFAFLETYLPCRLYMYQVDQTLYYTHPGLSDPEHFIDEQNARPDIKEYKKFTTEEIYAAGKDYPFCTAGIDLPESKALLKELQKRNKEDFLEIPDYNSFYFTVQDSLKELINEFTENCKFGSLAEINSLMGKVTAFSNAIPRWDLKGYSSNEIFQKFEKPKLQPLPESGFTPYSPDDIINSYLRMSGGIPKVGRNEPCPCGSGKKYKDCHGKYQS